MLPLDARKKFQLHCKPIFSLMESAPYLAILPVMDTDSISLSFSVGKQYLKARVSYAFESVQATPYRWGISTWSKKVARSSILKHGNVSDKANIPVATRHINLGSNATSARGLLQNFEELADESKESQQLPMTATVMGRSGYYRLLTLQQLPLLMVKRLRGRLLRRWPKS
jgi:hypothetical protein